MHNRALVEAAAACLDLTTRAFFEKAYEAWFRLPPDEDCYRAHQYFLRSPGYDPVLPSWITQLAKQTLLEAI